MKYDASSRYRLNVDGQTASRISVASSRHSLYVVRDGDTLESITSRQFGNPKRYWEIADLNPQVQFPLDLVIGSTIRLPR